MSNATNSAADFGDTGTIVECLNVMVVNQDNLAGLQNAGITAASITAVRPLHKTLPEALVDIAGVRDEIDVNSEHAFLAESVADIRRAKVEGRTGVILNMQDARPIHEEVAYLRTYRDLGVRVMQLTHNYQGIIGTGCLGRDSGLTQFGAKVVRTMNRLGIAVDLSHCGPQTTLDAVECSEVPAFCSHSNPKAICDSPRNKSDEIIERVAARGGIIGIASYGPIVYRGGNKRPTIEDVLDCIEHVLRLVGPDHVAMGTDTCEGRFTTEAAWEAAWGRASGSYPEMLESLGSWYTWHTWYAEGLETTRKMPAVAEGLRQRGHSADTVRKVMGESALAYFERVWDR